MTIIGHIAVMAVVFWLVSSEDRNEQRKQELRNTCYQLAEVEEVYRSQYECIRDNARKGR